jgi:hypothetical protein
MESKYEYHCVNVGGILNEPELKRLRMVYRKEKPKKASKTGIPKTFLRYVDG